MGAFTSTMLAVGVGMQAYGQYSAGQKAKDAYEYNANVFNAQENMLAEQKALTAKEHERTIRHLEGATTVAVAGSGYDMSGSYLEVMKDTLTQAHLDKEKELYNLEAERMLAKSRASEARRMGDNASRAGTIGAFSTVLTGGSKWYQQYGGFGKTG